MRIITGLLKGRTIDIPKSLNVRPTTDRTKEGIFGVIEARRFIHRTTVLDLFAGSGNLGYEALSRGAYNVLFVDKDHRNLQHIEKLGQQFEMSNQIRTAATDAQGFLEGPPVPYDLIFADPPYHYPRLDELLETIIERGWLQPDGWFILEHDRHHDFSGHSHYLLHKEYGRTYASFFLGSPVES